MKTFWSTNGRLIGTLLIAASVITLLSSTGIYPFISLIEASQNKSLSPEFARLLKSGQCWFGISLFAVSAALIATQRLTKNPLPESRGRPFNRLLFFIALVGGVLSALVQLVVFDNMPHITDATSHVFQAKIFAGGSLAVENPPCYEAFFQHNVVIGKSGFWHTKYFPGQALWLTPGFIVHAGWLMMPVGWCITIFAFGYLIRRFYSDDESLLAAFLLATSPLGLLVSASYMSHTTLLMFAITACAFIACAHDASRPGKQTACLLTAGLLIGMAVITRPQDLAPFGIGALTFFAVASTGVQYFLWRAVPKILAGLTLPLLFLLCWNHSLYGHLLSSGYHFGESISLTPIIRDSLGFTESHTPTRALSFAAITLYRFDGALSGWPTSLAWCLLPLFYRKDLGKNLVCVSVVGSTIGLYLLFHYLGFELEARYYTPALPAAILLVTRGLSLLSERLFSTIASRRALLVSLVAGLSVYSVGYYWPLYIWPKYADQYEQASRDYHEQAVVVWRTNKEQKLLVLIESMGHMDFNYSGGFAFNDPQLSGPIIYGRYIKALIPCLVDQFPDRKLMLITRDGKLIDYMP